MGNSFIQGLWEKLTGFRLVFCHMDHALVLNQSCLALCVVLITTNPTLSLIIILKKSLNTTLLFLRFFHELNSKI